MATALRFDEAAPGQDLAPRNDNAAMNVEWDGAVPTRYVVREIEFKVVNGRLQFSYRNECGAHDLPADGIEGLTHAFCQPAAPAGAGPFPIPAALAPQTPLDLEVKGGRDPLIIFLKLAEPGNMTFSETRSAVTHKNGDHAVYYGGLRHVGVRGVGSAAPLADCKLVYFVAAPPPGDYQHGFNFNVDLEQDPGPDGGRRVLPLTIDPDVRFPGGSGTGG